MNNEQKTQLQAILKGAGYDSRDAMEFPLMKGDVFTFTTDNVVPVGQSYSVNGNVGTSYAFVDKDGKRLPLKYIPRNRNGLNLTPAKQSAMIEEFASRFTDEGYVVTIADLKKQEANSYDGKVTYIHFAVAEAVAPAEEVAEAAPTRARRR